MREMVRTLLGVQRIKGKDLVERVGIHRSSLHRFFNNETDLGCDTFVEILRAAGIDLEKIILSKIKRRLGHSDGDNVSLGEEVEMMFPRLNRLDQRNLLNSLIVKAQNLEGSGETGSQLVKRLEEFKTRIQKKESSP